VNESSPDAAEVVRAEDAAATRAAGARFAQRLGPGDLVILSGELGAGKTTFTQGLAEGLGVRGPITSPTFVLARVHPSLTGGPDLVHVDAYRLGSLAELDDLDLDASMDDSVTVVEWGEGKAEALAEGRAYHVVRFDRSRADDVRELVFRRG
jgi:tRNA threonylcarbamoyladenosine biosynthesis protein TsaE